MVYSEDDRDGDSETEESGVKRLSSADWRRITLALYLAQQWEITLAEGCVHSDPDRTVAEASAREFASLRERLLLDGRGD